jgi:polysaccharide pyruvyl transferase WcaK-like protein
MKKKILLMDAYSTIHVGNGALLDNTIKLAKLGFTDSDITIFSTDIETCKLQYKDVYKPMYGYFWRGLSGAKKYFWAFKQVLHIMVQYINEITVKISPEKLAFNNDQKIALKKMMEADICISLSGENINDTFYQALYFWLFSYWLVIRKGKKFVLFPQSIGPLNNKLNRWMVYNCLKNASLLVGRDQKSYETLVSLGLDKDKIMFVPDVAIQQDVKEDINIHKYFNNENKKVIGVTVSKIPSEIKTDVDYTEKVYNALVSSVDKNKYKILLMPSNYIKDGVSEDYKLCTALKERLSNNFEVAIIENKPHFSDEYKSLLLQLEFFISTRMHVSILATSGYIPTIAINTQHKIRGYMENIDMGKTCIDMDKLDELSELICIVMNNRKSISDNLAISINRLKEIQNIFIERLEKLYD